MPSPVSAITVPPLYQLIHSVLERNIRSGKLPLGLVLLEKPLSELFHTSRAPVQRALTTLESQSLICRFDGRGYLVGSHAEGTVPLRQDLRTLPISLATEVGETFETRASWERIYEVVESAVASCLVFGTYRIIESELANHFGVSRTVARDVLSRLHEHGLVRKGPTSHWLAGPLSAKDIRESFEIRRLLEPAALIEAAGVVTRHDLQLMRDRVEKLMNQNHWQPEAIDQIERDLHSTLTLSAPNQKLVDSIRHLQFPIQESERFLRTVGIPTDRAIASEHLLIYDHLLNDALRDGAIALEAHLNAEMRRSLALLKTVAVINEPTQFAPYLKRITVHSQHPMPRDRTSNMPAKPTRVRPADQCLRP